MSLDEFINRVCDDGIAACIADYAHDDTKRLGAIAGFEACRGKSPNQLIDLLSKAGQDMARKHGDDDYWYFACFRAEVEWVCNCVSAATRTQLASYLPTARGALKAAEIVGVAP